MSNHRDSTTIRLESSLYDVPGTYSAGAQKALSANASMNSGQTAVMINLTEYDSEETVNALISLVRGRAFEMLARARAARISSANDEAARHGPGT